MKHLMMTCCAAALPNTLPEGEFDTRMKGCFRNAESSRPSRDASAVSRRVGA